MTLPRQRVNAPGHDTTNLCKRFVMLRNPTIPIPDEDGATARLPMYRLDGSLRAYSTIDLVDVEWVSQYRWWMSSRYVMRHARVGEGLHIVLLHREILGLPRIFDGRMVDHIDRNGLNNRRNNLRIVNHAENMQNRPSHAGSSSRYRGVYWDRSRQKWRAKIVLQGKTIRLGRFDSEDEAGAVAMTARLRLMSFSTD